MGCHNTKIYKLSYKPYIKIKEPTIDSKMDTKSNETRHPNMEFPENSKLSKIEKNIKNIIKSNSENLLNNHIVNNTECVQDINFCYECDDIYILFVTYHCNKCNKCHNRYKNIYCETCNICIDHSNQMDIILHKKKCDLFLRNKLREHITVSTA